MRSDLIAMEQPHCNNPKECKQLMLTFTKISLKILLNPKITQIKKVMRKRNEKNEMNLVKS